MRSFRRIRGRYWASFDPIEVSVLSDLVDQVRQLLAGRRSEQPDDPLVALTGMIVGPTRPPEDPALARLLPDFHHDDPDLSAGLRALREPALIQAKDQAATDVLDSLPPGGGSVRLTEDQAQSWIAALNDVRLALGVRLGVTDDGGDLDEGADDHDPGDEGDDPSSTAPIRQTYRWLTYVQDSLVSQMLD